MRDSLLDKSIPKKLLDLPEQELRKLFNKKFWENNDVGYEPVS